jgi:2-polyprenyl-6-methoxyphenol 4-hydroxylase
VSAEHNCDVLIAGGGMVGLSLALALDQLSGGRLRLVLAEGFAIPAAAQAPGYRPSFDARATALAHGSRSILERLGVWQVLAPHATPITDIHVSERGRFGSVALDARARGWPALGYVVENAWLGNVLLAAARQRAAITLLSPAKVLDCAPGANGATATLEHHGERRPLRCALIAIADGAESGLRERLGIGRRVGDYGQRAIIANVCCRRPHAGWAYERFTDWGPMALLPLADSDGGEPRMALVWTMAPERAASLLAASDGVFLNTLQQRFGQRQGPFTRVGQRHDYALRLVAAEEQVRRQVVLVGNAAHSLHPVAGQGFNLALRDVQRLAETVAAAAARGETIGELPVLQRYQQRQAADQWRTTVFSERLIDVFNRPQWLLGALRRSGLFALDLNPALKSRFIDHTAGHHAGAALGLPT